MKLLTKKSLMCRKLHESHTSFAVCHFQRSLWLADGKPTQEWGGGAGWLLGQRQIFFRVTLGKDRSSAAEYIHLPC